MGDFPWIDVAAGIVWRSGKILISERKLNPPAQTPAQKLWEFPGGKQEPDESIEDCLKRELLEELDILISEPKFLTTVEHSYPHINIRLHCFQALWLRQEPKGLEGQSFQWISPSELPELNMTSADLKVIDKILDEENVRLYLRSS